MNRNILRIALPSIVSNLTVPLLGLADTAIAGHLGAAAHIGAIAVGGMLFSMVYWLFGFLRMGTGGFTAQAYGAGRHDETLRVLLRALLVAAAVAGGLLMLQSPIADLAFRWLNASPQVEVFARQYFDILIWGAPAMLGLYVFSGWFLGMQDARSPMLISITQNLVNIAGSLLLVMQFGLGIAGVALGTLVAQYVGLMIAVGLFAKRWHGKPDGRALIHWREVLSRSALMRFFNVNRDIFFRTLCLVAVSTYFTSAGAAQGETVLAANALLMQFFMFFSYFMDGFAYAGEALGGRYFGAADAANFRKLVRQLFLWGAVMAILFAGIYALGGNFFIRCLTDESSVRAVARSFLPYAVGVPVVSFAAFLFDGLFIGTTSTREMLLAMAGACAAFFGVWWLWGEKFGNDALWCAFLSYLWLRGILQWALLRRVTGKLYICEDKRTAGHA